MGGPLNKKFPAVENRHVQIEKNQFWRSLVCLENFLVGFVN
jgi:hypothetical protein